MKKLFVIGLICTVAFMSCKKDQTTSSSDQSINVSELPSAVVQYVDNNYPDASIYSAITTSNSSARYIVTLNTTEELSFSDMGSFTGGDFPHGGHGHHGGCGNDSLSGNGHGNGPHGGPHGGIPIDSLPAVITDYVTTNFPGDSILHAMHDSLCSYGLLTIIVVSQTGTVPVKLTFDASGNYLFSGERIDYSLVPTAVSDFITATYPTFTPRQKALEFTLAGGNKQYNIFLHQQQPKARKRVLVNADGSLVCEQ